MKKKILSYLLAVSVVISMVPAVPAFAEDSGEAEEVIPAEEVIIDEEVPEEAQEEPYYHGFEEVDGVITGKHGEEDQSIKDVNLMLLVDENGITALDPAGDTEGAIWHFDGEGAGTKIEKDGIYEISYIEKKAEYLVTDGMISKSAEDEYIIIDKTAYIWHADGTVEKVTEKKYISVDGILYKTEIDGATTPYSGIYEDTGIYYIDGVVAAKGTVVVIDSLRYAVQSDGTIKLLTGFDGNQYYYKGKKSTTTGIRKGKYIVDGKIKTSSSSFNLVVDSYMYSVAKDGTAKKKTKSGTASFYAYGKKLGGSYYMYKVSPKTAKASIYKKSTKHTDYYVKVTEGRAYEVFSKTGKARAFTGVKSGRYYKSSKLGKADSTYYVIYGQYVYKVKADGTCSKYIKKRLKRGTYVKTVSGCRATIYYRSGKIKKKTCLNPTRKEFVDCAASYMDINDRYNDQDVILDLYNSYLPHPRGYRMTVHDPWCATFVSAIAVKLGYTDLIRPECSCYYQVEAFKKKGRWKESDSYVPKPGDIIYYDWQAAKKGDCKGCPDHVGIVEKVSGGKITVIEGNKCPEGSHVGSVARRVIPVNYRYIRGFGLPKYKG